MQDFFTEGAPQGDPVLAFAGGRRAETAQEMPTECRSIRFSPRRCLRRPRHASPLWNCATLWVKPATPYSSAPCGSTVPAYWCGPRASVSSSAATATGARFCLPSSISSMGRRSWRSPNISPPSGSREVLVSEETPSGLRRSSRALEAIVQPAAHILDLHARAIVLPRGYAGPCRSFEKISPLP